MTAPRIWVWTAAALVVAGAGLVALLRQQAMPVAPVAAPAVQEAAVAVAPLAAAPSNSAAAASLEPPPPWAAALPGAAVPQTPAQRQALLAQLRERNLQQAEMSQRLLAELDRRQAANQLPPGVNVQAMRENLRIGQQLQQLSMQIQTLATQPDGPQRREALRAKLAELQQLQQRVRLDVMAPVASAAQAAPAAAGKQ